MARHVELRNHADSPIVRVLDDFANLLLRVVEAVRTLLLKEGEYFAFDAKTLVIGKVPMKDV